MKLTISMQATLDGVAQANGGNNDEMDPGFTRGGWALPLGDEEGVQYILDTWRRPDAFLLGRKTFGLFETYWGARSDDGGFGEAISSKPKYVVSTTLTDPSWQQTTVISGDVAAGSANSRRSRAANCSWSAARRSRAGCSRTSLSTRLNLVQFPVIVGEGERLFPQRVATSRSSWSTRASSARASSPSPTASAAARLRLRGSDSCST